MLQTVNTAGYAFVRADLICNVCEVFEMEKPSPSNNEEVQIVCFSVLLNTASLSFVSRVPEY